MAQLRSYGPLPNSILATTRVGGGSIKRRPFSFQASAKINRSLHMKIRTFSRGAPFLAVLIGGLTALGAETSVVPEPGDLRTAGTVDFPVSCGPAVRAQFIRGVALLHS